MNISIFGLGYVGAVTAACLARRGHAIVGVDVHAQKVESFNRGVPPIIEPGLEELLRLAKTKGLLRATRDAGEAVAATDVSLICVGTPSQVTGAIDLSYVRQVLHEIGAALPARRKPHALVIRSTLLPGSTARLTAELPAGLEGPDGVQVYYHPEFMRESTAVADFEEPPLAVVGTRGAQAPLPDLKHALFGGQASVVSWETAEMLKYACNAFHATKVAFANEIGRLCKTIKVDARAVMDLFCQDQRLNLSPYYLRPGNPFGGSCLPKDVRALAAQARLNGLDLPLVESLLPSNERHLQSLLGLVMESGQSEVVILGLSFKAQTDDVRESAMVEVAQTLVGRGCAVRIYDPSVKPAALIGSNKREAETKVPNLGALLKPDLKSALGDRGLVIAAQRCVTVDELSRCITPQHQVLDVNGWEELRALPCKYEGFCW